MVTLCRPLVEIVRNCRPSRLSIFNTDMSFLARLSPAHPALDRRLRHDALRSEHWNGDRRRIIISLLAPFLIIQLLFLGLQAYVFGSSFGSPERLDKLHVLAIDYDQGIVGNALRAASSHLEGPSMLGFEWRSVKEYPDPFEVHKAVRDGVYWASVQVMEGATSRLEDAIADNTTAAAYDAKGAVKIVYNEARYPDFEDLFVAGNLGVLVQTGRLFYNQINGTRALASIPSQNTASLLAVLEAIDATTDNIKPLGNGSTVFYNTVDIVLTILLQFYFLMAYNGLMEDWQLDSKLPLKHHVVARIVVGVVYTFLGSLALVANIYGFRGTTSISGTQFVILWMAFWLEMHVLFLVLEIAITFLDLPWLPLFIVTFIIVNVTSTIFPFELSPGFYRWGSALPCHQVYMLEISVLSGGADNHVQIALPVLFAWWIVCIPLAFFSIIWRCTRSAPPNVASTGMSDEKRGSDGGSNGTDASNVVEPC